MPTPIAVDHLVAGVLEDVAAREARVSFKEVKARSRDMEPPRDARAALLAQVARSSRSSSAPYPTAVKSLMLALRNRWRNGPAPLNIAAYISWHARLISAASTVL